jgi:hypothetical protein
MDRMKRRNHVAKNFVKMLKLKTNTSFHTNLRGERDGI